MKRIISISIAILALSLTLSAQKGNVSSADYELTLDKPDLKKAEGKILDAEKHEKTANWPKTYMVKERIFRAKYAKKNTELDNLITAFEAIKKAEELDIKGDAKGKNKLKYRDEIRKDLIMLRIDFQNFGATVYNEKDYTQALTCFENVLAIDAMPSYIEEDATATIDTAIVFNTAICAYYGENKPKTAEYMLRCIDYAYGETTPYIVMYTQYKEAEDTVKMVEILKEGFKTFPEDGTFLKELVIYYIGTKDLDEGMKYLKIALENDPENSSFWFTKGTFHDQLGEMDQAMVAYNKALETANTDDDKYNANYNVGVIVYNEAVEAINAANDEPDMKKSNQMTLDAREKFKICLPYFEVCIGIKPNDLETLKALSPVYYRLSNDDAMQEKYLEVQATIKVVKGE
jgi:hypothetical protein